MTVLDKKISELNAGGAAQSGDELIVARSGSNVKVTGANVAAAATSVGTLSSLTVSGDLTVDTSTLKVDSANNRVGIGTATPNVLFEVGNAGAGASVARLSGFNDANNSAYATLQFFNEDASGQGPNIAASIKALTAANSNGSGGQLSFSVSSGTGSEGAEAAEAMRIDASGNVGIGVTPTVRLTVGSTSDVSNFIRVNTSTATGNFGMDAIGAYVGTDNNYPTRLFSNNTERARITSGGNFIPGANNAYSLGDGSTRWTEVFAINGTINTSDANAKTDVQEDVPGWEFVKALRPVHYVWKVRKREAVQVEDGTELVEIPAELDADGNEIAPARTEERPKFRA